MLSAFLDSIKIRKPRIEFRAINLSCLQHSWASQINLNKLFFRLKLTLNKLKSQEYGWNPLPNLNFLLVGKRIIIIGNVKNEGIHSWQIKTWFPSIFLSQSNYGNSVAVKKWKRELYPLQRAKAPLQKKHDEYEKVIHTFSSTKYLRFRTPTIFLRSL